LNCAEFIPQPLVKLHKSEKELSLEECAAMVSSADHGREIREGTLYFYENSASTADLA
jgi:hypothetical protein